MSYLLHIVVVASLYGVLALGQNFIFGRGGMLFVAQAGLMAIGAYTSSLLSLSGVDPWIALLAGSLSAAIVSVPLGMPALRLKGDYLLISSLGFCEIIRSILNNWSGVTGGASGLSNIKSLTFMYYELNGPHDFAFLAFGLLSVTFTLYYLLDHSPFGRLVVAIGEDEDTARSLGKAVRSTRVAVISFPALLTGLAGGIWASYLGYIEPGGFSVWESVFILSMVVLGGAGNSVGTMLGTVTLVVLPEMLRFVGFPQSTAQPLRQILFGATLIIVMRFRPRGVLG